MPPRRRVEGHINLPLSVRSSVRIQIHGLFGCLLLQFWSYSFNILQDVYACPQDCDFFKYSQNDRWLDLVILFVRPYIYIYMVYPAISSYSYGATALIFCMVFMHIMEVDLFIISYGQVGASFVSYRHTSFLNKSLLTKQLCP